MEHNNVWVCRMDTYSVHKTELSQELENGYLRQGWGWDEKQNLRALTMDQGAKRNLPMYNRVKKGDLLLIPHYPEYSQVMIVSAREDFKEGYSFDLQNGWQDYGHRFPITIKGVFNRHNINVSSRIQSTLRTRMRFWNITNLRDDILLLLSKEASELLTDVDKKDLFDKLMDSAFLFHELEVYKQRLLDDFSNKFQASGWEYVLQYCFQILYPAYDVQRVGGPNEKEHGTDIVINIPGVNGKQYVIAIQVKDFSLKVGSNPIYQINKSDQFWSSKNEIELVDKYVALIHATSEQNKEFERLAAENGVSILYESDIKEILMQTAMKLYSSSI